HGRHVRHARAGDLDDGVRGNPGGRRHALTTARARVASAGRRRGPVRPGGRPAPDRPNYAIPEMTRAPAGGRIAAFVAHVSRGGNPMSAEMKPPGARQTYPTSPKAQKPAVRGDRITGDRYWSTEFAQKE